VRKAAIRRLVPRLLWPGWPDEARRVVQEPEFRRGVAAVPRGEPCGRCLNAGCGEGLYSPFIESFEQVTHILNIDIAQPHICERRSDPRNADAVGSVRRCLPRTARSTGSSAPRSSSTCRMTAPRPSSSAAC
jgi:hypothetical protein